MINTGCSIRELGKVSCAYLDNFVNFNYDLNLKNSKLLSPSNLRGIHKLHEQSLGEAWG